MKLRQMISDKFKKIYLRHNEKENFKLLDRCLDEIFSTGKVLDLDLKNLNREGKNVQNEYKRQYLPFHTRDEAWLAKYVEEVFNRVRAYKMIEKNHQSSFNIGFKKISAQDFQSYVAQSPKFAARRDDYEQDVVMKYCAAFSNFEQDDFYYSAEHKKKFWREGQDLHYDDIVLDAIGFRRHITSAMDFLGIDSHNTKVSLELNARSWRNDVWRNDIISRLMHGVMVKNDSTMIPSIDRKKLKEIDASQYYRLSLIENHLVNMNKAINEYLYYNAQKEDTKAIIDELNIATHSMKLSPKQFDNMERPMLHLCKEYTNQFMNCQNVLSKSQDDALTIS